MSATVCYYIQSHRDPEQIYRLVQTLRKGSRRGVIVVQHDATRCALDWAPLAALADVHLLPAYATPRVRSEFGGQLEPYLDAARWLERQGVAYDWLASLTAQDYPVTPVPRIEEYLSSSNADGYLHYWDVLSPRSPWSRRKARVRYWYKYWRLPDWTTPMLHATRVLTKVLPIHFYLDYGPYVGVRRLRTPFGADFRCHGGWTWSSLRHEVVRYVLDFLLAHPAIEAHYRRTVAAEESMVPTVLANSGRFALVDDALRYVDYTGARQGYPRVLTRADLPMLRSGRYHFARKFDLAVDRQVLDDIDRELLASAPEAA